MTASERELCVLVADVDGNSRLTEKLGHSEASRAVERCVKRMERAVVGQGGRLFEPTQGDFAAVFSSPDAALQAAHEMQQRVADLPPISGVKLALHVGLHCGQLVEDGTRMSGEGSEVAARLVRLAGVGQVVTSAATVRLLSPGLRHAARELTDIGTNDSGQVVYEVAWPGAAQPADGVETHVFPFSDDAPHTVIDVQPAIARPQSPAIAPPAARKLLVRHLGGEVTVDAMRRIVTLGRDPSNDIVIFDKRASRSHARIERRRGKFYLIDGSTNGTFVTFQGESEFLLKKEELALRDRGRFCCGHSRAEGTERVEFELQG